MEIHETPLPGVGVRYDFTTTDGRQMGVVTHHTGRRELVVYDRNDPDASREIVSLNGEEAETLASLLGAARITAALNDLQHQVEGLAIDWLDVRAGTPFSHRALAETQARTRTGVSIVAILRGRHAVPSPRPDFVFEPGDILVVAGTPDGIRELSSILAG